MKHCDPSSSRVMDAAPTRSHSSQQDTCGPSPLRDPCAPCAPCVPPHSCLQHLLLPALSWWFSFILVASPALPLFGGAHRPKCSSFTKPLPLPAHTGFSRAWHFGSCHFRVNPCPSPSTLHVSFHSSEKTAAGGAPESAGAQQRGVGVPRPLHGDPLCEGCGQTRTAGQTQTVLSDRVCSLIC